uniref:Shootin-1-like n=1 Tax=Salmo trutta TaxID=8032 RepID=A0A674B6F2_SALTR
IEEVSSQLLKEMDVLEMQFQIERSCRESAEALAVKVIKENKVLKRRSQALLPLLPKLPENMATMTFDLESDQVVDPNPDGDSGEEAVLQEQAQIRELQASVEQLLGEKMQLCEQVDSLKREQSQLEEQLALEIGVKEAILKKLSKQNKNMNKMKRVSQLVTEEFTEISQKLELEQGLREHAEVFAHQVLVKQKETQRQSMVLQQSSETSLQLQQALEQVAHISSTLQDIQHYYRNQVDGGCVLISLCPIFNIQTNAILRYSNMTQCCGWWYFLFVLVKQLEDRLKDAEKDLVSEKDNSTPALPPPLPPPPPPPLPPPPSSTHIYCVVSLSPSEPDPTLDMKSRAVDAMMERIKKGIVLRPTQRPQVGLDSDQRIEKRKSAVLELKGMLDTMKHQGHRRAWSRNRLSRNVGEAELQMVLQRRRRAMADGQDTPSPQPGGPAAGALPWAGESGSTPVLRRLQQNREKRNSRIRESKLIICQENI